MASSTSSLRLIHRCESNEAAAYRSIFEVAERIHGKGAFAIDETADSLLLISPLVSQAGVFNRVLGLGMQHAPSKDGIRQVVRRYQDLGCGLAVDLVEPITTSELRSALRELRIRRGNMSAVVSGTPHAPPPIDHSVRVVLARGTERQAVADICADVFGMPTPVRQVLAALGEAPGWRMWLAVANDEPAGAALSFVHGRDCWFGWAATRFKFRGLGVKSLIDNFRLANALESGCEFVSSETAAGTPERPDHSLKSFLRLGFATAYLRGTYLLVPEQS